MSKPTTTSTPPLPDKGPVSPDAKDPAPPATTGQTKSSASADPLPANATNEGDTPKKPATPADPSEPEPTEKPAASKAVAAASPEAPPTTSKPPAPVKHVTEELESVTLDAKLSQTLIPSTDQYIEPGLLPTTDRGMETHVAMEGFNNEGVEEEEVEDDDDDDYDDDGTDNLYENLEDVKLQAESRLPPPDDLEVNRYKGAESYNSEDEDSHFFFHLVILAFLVAIVYITYHNKRKVSVGMV